MSHNRRRLHRGQRRRTDSRRQRAGDRGRAGRRKGDQSAQVRRVERQPRRNFHQARRAGESRLRNSPIWPTGFRFSKTTPIFATNLALNERPKYITEEKYPEVAGVVHAHRRLGEYEDLRQPIRRLPQRAAAAQAIHERRDAVVPRSDPGAARQSDGVHVAADDLQSWGNPPNWDKARDEWFKKQLAAGRSSRRISTRTIFSRPIRRRRSISSATTITCTAATGWSANTPASRRWRTGRFPVGPNTTRRSRAIHVRLVLPSRRQHHRRAGYNAAKMIAESLGLKTWWNPVDFRDI